MAGPLRRDKPVLIPMYAEILQRPPPPRPFLNLLRSPVHLPLRCLVRALLGLPTVVVGAFFSTRHRDLSNSAPPLWSAELRSRPATGNQGREPWAHTPRPEAERNYAAHVRADQQAPLPRASQMSVVICPGSGW
jgi:hypothetical protein